MTLDHLFDIITQIKNGLMHTLLAFQYDLFIYIPLFASTHRP